MILEKMLLFWHQSEIIASYNKDWNKSSKKGASLRPGQRVHRLLENIIMNQTSGKSMVDRSMANEKARMLYAERKRSHLCVKCGKVNETEKAYCPDCSFKRNEYVRQNRIFYMEHGLCSVCGRNRVFRNERMCPECRARDCIAAERLRTANMGKYRKVCRERNKMKYWERAGQGVCVKCGRNNSVPGKRKCRICLKKQSEYMNKYNQARRTGIPRNEWPQYGLCQTCGNKLDMEGRKICNKCYENSMRALEKARISNNFWEKDNRLIFMPKVVRSCDAATEKAKNIFHTAPYIMLDN